MLIILPPENLTRTPWKNGGGVTREVARAEGEGGWIWRLSIADVATDGPFSHFAGMTRILTVIEGDGIDLVTPVGVVTASFARPVRFSGETPVEGRLLAGPIRDFNVIFDARRVLVTVEPVRGPAEVEAGPQETWFLCLAGKVLADGAPAPVGGFAHGTAGRIALGSGAAGLVARISPQP